jgi:hypothetical protein
LWLDAQRDSPAPRSGDASSFLDLTATWPPPGTVVKQASDWCINTAFVLGCVARSSAWLGIA